VSAVVALAIRSSVVTAAGLLLTALLAKRSAALRHRVLAGALLASAAVVPISLGLPEWNVTLPVRTSVPPLNVALASEPPAAAVEVQSPLPQRSMGSFLLLGWLTGAAVAALALIGALVRVRRMAARASRVDTRRWLEILDEIAHRYELSRPIVLARTDSAEMLATWGIRRPSVLLPRHAADWTLDRIRIVLAHELAHIRRHDWIVQIAAETVRVIFWFNPLVWIACRRLRRESEQACDDEVLGIGVSGGEYAAHLVDLARQCRTSRATWAAAIPMAHPSTLERRIAAMLNPRLERRPPSQRALAACGALLLLVVLPVSVMRARPAAPAPLTGTIYDVTGGVVPGVEVTLVDANEITWVVNSDASGRFEFPPVGPGKYVLKTALPGFRALRHEFELRDARDWDRAVTLQVGDLQETITVRESRAVLPKQLKPYATEPQRLRVGGNIRVPRKVLDVRPVYPPAMRAAGLAGVVPVEAIIGRDGTVSSVRVLSAQVHPDFAIAAVDAVRQWRFTPTLLNGSPVEVVMNVTVTFDLSE
jgi:TonB family protein